MVQPVSVTVQIPRALREFCDGAQTIALSAASVQDALAQIEQRYPAIHRGICDETGRLRPHIHLFVNSSLVRERRGLESPLKPGDVIVILPAVSGG